MAFPFVQRGAVRVADPSGSLADVVERLASSLRAETVDAVEIRGSTVSFFIESAHVARPWGGGWRFALFDEGKITVEPAARLLICFEARCTRALKANLTFALVAGVVAGLWQSSWGVAIFLAAILLYSAQYAFSYVRFSHWLWRVARSSTPLKTVPPVLDSGA
jgi:hypothetical protein